MARQTTSGIVGCALGLAAALLAGCSASPVSPFGGASDRTRLSKSAKALRAATPVAPDVPRELDKRLLPTYTVEPGDVLLVQPADLDSPARLPGDQPVLPDGSIHLGRYGRVIVAGRTLEEIEAQVREAVQAQTKDAGPITVRLVSRVSKVYYVLGEVNAPGAYPINGRETVLDGLVAAGGLTDRASARGILLSRPTPPESCRVVLPVCYQDIVQLGDTSTNYQLTPGDRIFVPGRSLREQLSPLPPKDCPPCGGPQVPCALPFAGCAAPALPPEVPAP